MQILCKWSEMPRYGEIQMVQIRTWPKCERGAKNLIKFKFKFKRVGRISRENTKKRSGWRVSVNKEKNAKILPKSSKQIRNK